MDHWILRRTWLAVVGLLALASAVGAEDGIPRDSRLAVHDRQRLLLNPMDDAASVTAGSWKMNGTYVTTAEDVPAKLGRTALTLGAAEAEQAGAKGDFRVYEDVPGETRTIGLWVHLAEDANVARLAFRFTIHRTKRCWPWFPRNGRAGSGSKWIWPIPSRRIRRPTRTKPSIPR